MISWRNKIPNYLFQIYEYIIKTNPHNFAFPNKLLFMIFAKVSLLIKDGLI